MTLPPPHPGLHLDRWAAWAPGLASQQAWRDWLRDPQPLTADGAVPPLAEMPAMMRRRIDPLGRVALQAAYWAQDEAPSGPVVFASRWGELARSVGMLQQLAAGEALSPTAFSLSVHNAIGALYSIARQDRHNYQAVSAGEFSVEAGFAEAAGLLADGADRVLFVYVDGPLPDLYREGASPAAPFDVPHAFACLLRPAAPGTVGIGLRSGVPDGRASTPLLPPGLAVLQFLLGDQAEMRHADDSACWTWSRHAG